jgi:site-specific DNA-methyltransferase (adenine-specific)
VNKVHHAQALDVLSSLQTSTIDLIYTDPPFGTQNHQILNRKKLGETVSTIGYSDHYDDYMSWLVPHLSEFHRVLKQTGTLYLHLDWRWSHYAKVELDKIFGHDCFLNEIIWAYDFGGRGKRCWPKKHDTILVYSREKDKHVFNWDDIDKIPYMAPGLQKDPTRAVEGKVPTDVWWMSIVGTQSKERTGYPNQKPTKLIERAILASSNSGSIVLDPFAGSGTTGEAANNHNRKFILSDTNLTSIEIMRQRFKNIEVVYE